MEKDTCPNFFYTLHKAPKKSESSFSHPFLAVFPLLALKVLISQNGQTPKQFVGKLQISRCNFWNNSKSTLNYIIKLGQAIHH